MTTYTFDGTLNGLLSAVFDAFDRRESPDMLLTAGDELPLFGDVPHAVTTDVEHARRVYEGLEKRLSPDAMRLVSVSWLSELKELNSPLFRYICKVFRQNPGEPPPETNFADPDVLAVANIAHKVLHEQLRMKQFIRFQKAKDGTYLAVVSPDHNVLPLITDHFADRFNDQTWLIYDARRHYGYYYEGGDASRDNTPTRITFDNDTEAPFSLADGKLDEVLLADNDRLMQDLWRTYFKAICIRERLNPRKQLNDMPRRYWKYMTEKQ